MTYRLPGPKLQTPDKTIASTRRPQKPHLRTILTFNLHNRSAKLISPLLLKWSSQKDKKAKDSLLPTLSRTSSVTNLISLHDTHPPTPWQSRSLSSSQLPRAFYYTCRYLDMLTSFIDDGLAVILCVLLLFVYTFSLDRLPALSWSDLAWFDLISLEDLCGEVERGEDKNEVCGVGLEKGNGLRGRKI